MLTTRNILASSAFGLAVACLAPSAARAKEVVVPAANCVEAAVSGIESGTARVGGGFVVSGGATASLVCPLPSDDLDSSGKGGGDDDGGSFATFRVSYLDSNGSGAGTSVSARLFRTTLAAGDAPVVNTVVCGADPLTPSPITAGPARARFSCPPLAEGGFYHLEVDLVSATDGTAAFVGIVAED